MGGAQGEGGKVPAEGGNARDGAVSAKKGGKA